MQWNASRRRVSWGGYPASGRPAVKDPAVPGGERHAPTDYQDPRFLIPFFIPRIGYCINFSVAHIFIQFGLAAL